MTMLSEAILRLTTVHLPFLEEMDQDHVVYQEERYYEHDIVSLRVILNVFSEYARGRSAMLTELPKPVRCVDMTRSLSDS